MWSVTLPGQMSVNITYDGFSGETSLSSFINTSVTDFRSDEFIHSTLEVTVYPEIPTNQILLKCSMGDSEPYATAIVNVNISSEWSVHIN